MIFEFISESVSVNLIKNRGEAKGSMQVEIDLDQGEILNQIDIEYVVKHYGSELLLEEIGKDSALWYFGVEE